MCGARIRWGGSMGSRPNGCSCASWTLHSDPSNNCTSVQFAPCSDARFWFVPWCVCLGTGARPDNSPKTLITQFLQYKPSRHTDTMQRLSRVLLAAALAAGGASAFLLPSVSRTTVVQVSQSASIQVGGGWGCDWVSRLLSMAYGESIPSDPAPAALVVW